MLLQRCRFISENLLRQLTTHRKRRYHIILTHTCSSSRFERSRAAALCADLCFLCSFQGCCNHSWSHHWEKVPTFHTDGGKWKWLFQLNTRAHAVVMPSFTLEMVLSWAKKLHLPVEFQSKAWWKGSKRETRQDKQGTAAEGCTPAACTLVNHTGSEAARAECTRSSPHHHSHSSQRMC